MRWRTTNKRTDDFFQLNSIMGDEVDGRGAGARLLKEFRQTATNIEHWSDIVLLWFPRRGHCWRCAAIKNRRDRGAFRT